MGHSFNGRTVALQATNKGSIPLCSTKTETAIFEVIRGIAQRIECYGSKRRDTGSTPVPSNLEILSCLARKLIQ